MAENGNGKRRAIITVVGKDSVGIIAAVTSLLADAKINILDLSSTILEDNFAMVLLADLQKSSLSIVQLSDKLTKLGKKIGQKIIVYDEKILKAMHRI